MVTNNQPEKTQVATRAATPEVQRREQSTAESQSVQTMEERDDFTASSQTPDKIKGWPPPPSTIRKKGIDLFLGILVNLGCVLAAAPFLVLAGFAAKHNGRDATPQEWSMMFSGMNASVTVFPLVFTAVLARTIKMVAQWRLQRGTTLGSVEQLLASRSLFGTLQAFWSLRVLNLLGLLLFLLAVISPLGGQSSLQMLKLEVKTVVSPYDVFYLSTQAGSHSEFDRNGWEPENSQSLSIVNSMYISSIGASDSVKSSPTDLWRNVKIPTLSRLQVGMPVGLGGWQDVPSTLRHDGYSSLIGIPVVGGSESVNISFTMETNYFTLTQCALETDPRGVQINPINIGIAEDHERNDPEDRLFWSGAPQFSRDGLPFVFAIDGLRGETDWQHETWVRSASNSTAFPQRSVALLPAYGAGVICRITTEYVEAAVDCLGLVCRVARVRASLQPHPHSHLVALEFSDLFRAFSHAFPLAVGTKSSAGKNAAELFLDNPTNTFFNTTRRDVQVADVDPENMAVRLGQLVNTYYMSSLSPWTLMAAQMDDGIYAIRMEGTSANFPATADLVVNGDIYVCQWAWWGVFVGACVVMVATASLAAALTYLCPGPDVLGYVSTLTQDSPYVHVAAGGSTLDGADRARLLKDLKVQLQDVQGEEELGKLAFASLHGRPKPLRVDRLYM